MVVVVAVLLLPIAQLQVLPSWSLLLLLLILFVLVATMVATVVLSAMEKPCNLYTNRLADDQENGTSSRKNR